MSTDRMVAIDRHIDESLDTWMSDLAGLCGVPSVSARHQATEECAELVRALLSRQGLEAEVLPTGGHPAVLGRAGGRRDRTMLFYNHYDVQPPEPLDLWHSPPFQAEIRDGRFYARGAKDDKGELMARLAAVAAVQAVDGELPCGVTWLVEGEEEVGSPNLPAFVERHAARLRCDVAVWEEGGTDSDGRLLLKLGHRGLLYVELSVRAMDADAHSGNANVLPNAAWRLAWALASLKGPDEVVRISGFYDDVRPVSARRRRLAEEMASGEDDLKRTFGLDQLLLGRAGTDVNDSLFEPTCNLAGIVAGYHQAGMKTVIPAAAAAKVDFRLLPDQDPLDVAAKLRRHLDLHGFADVRTEVLAAEPAGVVDPDAPVVTIAARTAEEVYGLPAQLVPTSGGTTPMYLFTRQGVPVLTPGVGFGSSNRAHSPNENIRIDDFRLCARHVARILSRFADA